MRLSKSIGIAGFCAFTLAAVFTGCGGGSSTTLVGPDPSTPTGLPVPGAAAPVNAYSGGQSPGAWSFTLDNTKNTFSYQPVSYPVPATTGSLQSSGGFSSLGAAGLAYEVLGRAAVLRPGSSASSPVFAVPQTQCYAINGRVRFQYIDLFAGTLESNPTPNSLDPIGYGSVVASTDSTGKTWQLESLQGSSLIQLLNQPVLTVLGPASFTGSCAASNGQAAISFSGSSLLNTAWASNGSNVFRLESATPSPLPQSNMWVGPSGFFAADQSDPTQSLPTGASVAGMVEPSAPLSTSTLTAGQYLGFLYEAPVQSSNSLQSPNGILPAVTAPIGFGQVIAGSGTTLTGGIFPSDNITGTPNSDIQINLGAESTTQNGLYISVMITVLDPQQNCANFSGSASGGFAPQGVSSGLNAQGYITCTFPGVAVAGNPDGKYAIFVRTYNWAANIGGVGETFFLFQQ